MADPVADFLNQQFGRVGQTDLQRPLPQFRRGAPNSLGETFGRGVDAGIKGLSADVDYFQALAGTLVGADEFAADNVREARMNQERAADYLQGVESFAEFIDEPTVGGFFNQVASGVGQLVPSAISTVAGAGVGSVTAVAGRAILGSSSRAAAKKILSESLEKVAKGTASPSDLDIAQSAWDLYRASGVGAAAKTGALAGAGVSEYVPLAGSNLSEALESGRDLDPIEALRAGFVAAPQAAIGVGGEVALLRLVGEKAKRLSTGDSTVMGRLANDIATGFFRGGAIEASTELAQEGIAVANRSQMDENFSGQDAKLRLGEAAFAAFFGGGAAGSAAAGLGGTARELGNAPDTLSGVMDQARTWLDQGQEQQVNQKSSEEETGGVDPQFSNPEPQADINAQLESMLDPASTKDAVWIEGSEPALGVSANGKLNGNLEINGQRVFAAFVPGRGTVVSQYADVVQEVIKGGATDQVLASALGYGASKPAAGGDRVVQVRNARGQIISEEVASDETLPAAVAAAEGIMNKAKGDTYSIVDVKDAARDRAQRLSDEQGPVVRNMDLPDEVVEAFEGTDLSDPSFNIDELEDVTDYNYVSRQRGEDGAFPVFSDTQALRNEYDNLFGDTDWDSDVFGSMSDSALRAANRVGREGLEVEVSQPEGPSGRTQLTVRNFEQEVFKTRRQNDAGETEIVRLPIARFLQNEVSQASQQRPENRNAVIVRPDGSQAEVSLLSLAQAGRRVQQLRDPDGRQNVGANLVAMISALIQGGYEIRLGKKPKKNQQDRTQSLTAPLDQEVPDSVRELQAEEAQVGVLSPVSSDRSLLDAFLRAAVTPSTANIAALGEFANIRAGFIDDQPATIADVLRSNLPMEAEPEFDAPETRRAAGFDRDTRDRNTAVIFDYPDTIDGQQGVVRIAPQSTPGVVEVRSNLTSQVPKAERFGTNVAETQSGSSATAGPTVRAPLTRLPQEPFGTILPNNDPRFPRSTYETVTDAGAAQEGFDTPEGAAFEAGGETQLFGSNTGSRLIDDVAAPTHRYSTQSTKRRNASVNMPLASDTDRAAVALVVNVLNAAMSKLGMKRPVDVILMSQLADADQAGGFQLLGTQKFQRFRQQFSDPVVAQRVFEEAQNLINSDTGLGRMVGFADANFILVNDFKTNNALETALIASHELGHAFFREEMQGAVGKPVFKTLWAAYQKVKADPDTFDYSGPFGFEEWYSDQVAAWSFGEYRNSKARNLEESYFKRLVDKLRQMWTSIRSVLRKRFGTVDETFEAYMQDVVRANRANARTNEATAARTASAAGGINTAYHVRNLNDVVEGMDKGVNRPDGTTADFSGATLADQIRNIINQIRRDPRTNAVRKFLYTADSYLRKVASPEIADIFYVEAQQEGTRGRVGMLKRRDRAQRQLRKMFADMVGDPNDPAVQRAVAQAAGDRSADTDVMLVQAAQVREFLKRVYDEYIEPAQAGYPEGQRIQFAEDYFPVVHNLLAVSDNPDAYMALIMQYNPDANVESVRAAVSRMVQYHEAVQNNDLKIPELDPASGAQEARELTANVPREALMGDPNDPNSINFLVDPNDALQVYLNQLTKRVEWNRATKAADGTEMLQPLLDGLEDENRKEAMGVINAYLGYGNQTMDPFWRKTQSYLAAAQYTLLLPLAVIGSLPELAGPIINSKDLSSLEYAFRTMKESLTKSEARELAEDIGVVSNDALTNGYITAAEQEFLDPQARKWTDAFFRVTLLDQYTNFTRTFATGMGVQFLIRHAENATGNPNSSRYLRDLGVRAQDVKTWMNSSKDVVDPNDPKRRLVVRDLSTPEGKRVSDALYKFVESSILRPNAAERPLWASDPRFMLIWQLKSYFYAFHKVITTGAINELSARNEGQDSRTRVSNIGAMLALGAVASLPLAMMGMELREYAKQGAAEAITLGLNDKNYFRTDNMKWGDYLFTAIEKTGIYGPLGLVMQAQQSAQWGQGGIATLLGPTVETLEQALQDGFEVIPDRLIPVYSYLY